MARRSQITTFNYADADAPADFPARSTPVPCLVRDGRVDGYVHDAGNLMSSMETTGFTMVSLPVPGIKSDDELLDPEVVREKYVPWLTEYFRQATGCKEVASRSCPRVRARGTSGKHASMSRVHVDMNNYCQMCNSFVFLHTTWTCV